MRIGLVARCLNTAHVRGMGRYAFELMQQSAAEDLEWWVYGDDQRYPLHVPPALRGEVDIFPFRGDRFQLWEQLGLPQRARRHNLDVLHCTEGSLPRWQPVPTVVTLHDTLAWQEHDGTAASRYYWDRLMPAALLRCAAVLTISESSRRDILSKWPALDAKLTVIPHGIGNEYLHAQERIPVSKLQTGMGDKPYVVYLGGPLARKRFDWAVKVLEACGLPQLQLVACGFGNEARDKALAEVPEALNARVHFAPFLSNEELVSLYRGAHAVLYPTLYEGFGFPAIEAQAAGAPVILSPVSSLAELVGPLTLPVAATDLEAWVAAVRDAATMNTERVQRAQEARVWAQRFSWRRSFEAHLAVYRSAARAGSGQRRS